MSSFRESKAISVGQISKKFKSKNVYKLKIIYQLFWAFNRNIIKVLYVLRAKFKKISQKG